MELVMKMVSMVVVATWKEIAMEMETGMGMGLGMGMGMCQAQGFQEVLEGQEGSARFLEGWIGAAFDHRVAVSALCSLQGMPVQLRLQP